MSNVMRCPRRGESPQGPLNMPSDSDEYNAEDHTCSYCGSLDPAFLIARMEAGDVELGPTDKSYKVYVRNAGGAPLQRYHRECPDMDACRDYKTCQHWVLAEMSQGKFYFQHFSKEQQDTFISLYNAKRLKIGMPGHFYALPFFCRPADSATEV